MDSEKRKTIFFILIITFSCVLIFLMNSPITGNNITGLAISTKWCNGTDLNHDGTVDSSDQELLNVQFGRVDCSALNNWCSGADLNQDGSVNSGDLAIFGQNTGKTNCGIECTYRGYTCGQPNPSLGAFASCSDLGPNYFYLSNQTLDVSCDSGGQAGCCQYQQITPACNLTTISQQFSISPNSNILCSAGTPGVVTNNSKYWFWNCNALGTSNISCNATRKIITLCDQRGYICGKSSTSISQSCISQGIKYLGNSTLDSACGANLGCCYISPQCNATTTSQKFTSKPTENLCANGTAGAVFNDSKSWFWNCTSLGLESLGNQTIRCNSTIGVLTLCEQKGYKCLPESTTGNSSKVLCELSSMEYVLNSTLDNSCGETNKTGCCKLCNYGFNKTDGKCFLAASWKNTYSVSSTQFDNGYTKILNVSERLKIRISDEYHYVGILSVNDTKKTVKVEVSSTVQTAIISEGDYETFDVDDDDEDELKVTLDDISNGKAKITVESISETTDLTEANSVCGDDECNGTETCASCSDDCGECEEGETPISAGEGEETDNIWIYIVVIVLILIIFVGVLLYLSWRKNRQ